MPLPLLLHSNISLPCSTKWTMLIPNYVSDVLGSLLLHRHKKDQGGHSWVVGHDRNIAVYKEKFHSLHQRIFIVGQKRDSLKG
jgi:hypothetical protein